MINRNRQLIIKLAIGAMLFCLFSGAAANNSRLSDPTKPINYWTWYNAKQNTTKTKSTLNLQSILIAEDRKTAIINGQTTIVGSRINGANIIAINHNNVVIRYKGYDQTLHLASTNAVKKHRE